MLNSNPFGSFAASTSANANLKIDTVARRSELTNAIFKSFLANIEAVFDTHKNDKPYLVVDPIVLEMPGVAHDTDGPQRLYQNEIHKYFMSGMTLIEEDLFTQLTLIVKDSRHSTLFARFLLASMVKMMLTMLCRCSPPGSTMP